MAAKRPSRVARSLFGFTGRLLQSAGFALASPLMAWARPRAGIFIPRSAAAGNEPWSCRVRNDLMRSTRGRGQAARIAAGLSRQSGTGKGATSSQRLASRARREALMKFTRPARLAMGTVLVAAMAAVAMPPTAEAYRGGGFRGGFHRGGFRTGGFHRGGFRSGGFWHNANRRLNATAGRPAPSHGHGPVATRMSSSVSHGGFDRGGSGHGFHRFGVFGWVGPLFWPYAYNDIYCTVFWGYWGYGCADPNWSVADGDPFWGYGYGDVEGALFSPFTFDDLAPYLPNGPSSVRRARTKDASPDDAIAQMCGEDTREIAGWPIDRIVELVTPDDRQRAALEDLSSASVKAAQIIKSGCPTSVAFTATGRLEAMEQRIEAMEQAVDAVRRPLDAFYDSLTDEQKAKFNASSPSPPGLGKTARQRGTAQSCTAAAGATPWPEARIEAALQPNAQQQTKLKALQNAAAQAAELLAASCPAQPPATPSARLEAVSKRLEVMLTAVKNVRRALDGLYDGLSDQQKAQFNRIGQSVRQS
jgi:hypothetical protein